MFSNAFSGIWWSVSTLLTVGYGDIYPITTMGKIFSIFITFLGVGMVAIPTGIISAGFVDQYSRIKRISEYGAESDVRFIRIHLTHRDRWSGTAIRDLGHFPADRYRHDSPPGTDADPPRQSGSAGGRSGHSLFAIPSAPRAGYFNLRRPLYG